MRQWRLVAETSTWELGKHAEISFAVALASEDASVSFDNSQDTFQLGA